VDLAFVDRHGRTEPLKLPGASYEYPRVSPDGKRIAVDSDDGKDADVWICDVSGGSAPRRLTFGGRNRVPLWSADGTRVAFQSDREGDLAVFWQPADGSGVAERLTRPDAGVAHVPDSISPDGKRLLISVTKGSKTSLATVLLENKTLTPYDGVEGLQPPTAAFSPDGAFVAYHTPGGIFVQPFPPTGAKYQVIGGIHPFWSPNGKELFASLPGRFVALSVTTRPAFALGNPVDLPYALIDRGPASERAYDIMPDGQRFVGVVPAEGSTVSQAPHIYVVEHWFEELKARVPVR